MCCGLHLKHTAPEEALMVERERRPRVRGGFHLDLEEEKREANIMANKETGVKTSDLNVSSCFLDTWLSCCFSGATAGSLVLIRIRWSLRFSRELMKHA